MGAESKLAFRQVGAVDLVLNTDQYIKELRGTYQAKKMLDQKDTQDTMQSLAKTDKMMKDSFSTLDKELETSAKTHKKTRDEIISGFQVDPVKRPDIPDVEITDGIADEFNQELMAMEGNMNRFHSRMMDMGYDVGHGMTIEEDIGATLGGDAPQRKAAAAALEGMAHDEEQIQKNLKRDQKLRVERVAQLKKEGEEYGHMALELREQAKLHHGNSNYHKGLIKLAEELEDKVAQRTALIEEEEEKYENVNKEIEQSKRRLDDVNRTKEKGKNIDKSLSANDAKRNETEKKAHQKHKRDMRILLDLKRQELTVAKQRQRAIQDYTQQVDAMSQSIGQTLTGAIGLSIAAFAAMKMKLDSVVGTFQQFEKELVNAQSIFQTSHDTLFGLSDQIVQFGQNYGISMENSASGLYQLASAGLSAEDSMTVLNNTLKLSMAVQGDHNTISKLTTQTIFGFGLEMSDSAALTDKFAHAINKSLIEYQDLASAVKFAMPFFVSTGQSVDQLLGSLQVLTNRALEAGIAGRGLRQALAEFAQHAEDNTAAFAKMGVEITNADGTFRQLTDIAKQFQTVMGPAASDVDLMTTLLEDLNVRGATAFVHLVQNADEFQGAVNDLQNSTGSATEMAEIQQASLENQIQRVKNALQAPFLLSDEVGKANGVLNEFAMAVHQIAQNLEGMFVIVEDGIVQGLTPLGESLKDLAITALEQLNAVIVDVVAAMEKMSENGTDFTGMINMMVVPLRLIVKLLSYFGATAIEAALIFRFMNGILPITNILTNQLTAQTEKYIQALQNEIDLSKIEIGLTQQMNDGKITEDQMNAQLRDSQTASTKARANSISMMRYQMATMMAVNMIQFANIYLMRKYAKDAPMAAASIGILTGALMGMAFAFSAMKAGLITSPWGFLAYMAAGAAMMGTLNYAMTEMMKPPEVEQPEFDPVEPPTMDLGGRIMYDTGGVPGLGSRHRQVMVEPGETVIPKTQNMLGGGITLNIGGDIVTNDADDFADRVAIALPEALRRQSDMGGI